MRAVLKSGLAVLVALVAASYMGRLHGAGDALAVIRYPLLLGVLVVSFLLWRWPVAKGLAVVALALLAHRLVVMIPATPPAEVSFIHYQKNLLYRKADRTAFLADIAEAAPDFITLQEVSRANRPLLEALRDSHPHQHLCNGTSVGGIAVLSRWPITRAECSDPVGIVLSEVATPDGPVRIVSLHLHWPWPHPQKPQLDAALPLLEGLPPMRTIVGGDFNMVPWGASLSRVEDILGVDRIGHVERTFEVRGWPLTIDHVMAGPGATGQIEVRGRLGSDHFGVLGRLVFEDQDRRQVSASP